MKNSDIYVGSTADIKQRLKYHNAGKVRSTKAYRPWILLEKIECSSRSEAVKLEKFMKTGQQKELLRKKYVNVNEN